MRNSVEKVVKKNGKHTSLPQSLVYKLRAGKESITTVGIRYENIKVVKYMSRESK